MVIPVVQFAADMTVELVELACPPAALMKAVRLLLLLEFSTLVTNEVRLEVEAAVVPLVFTLNTMLVVICLIPDHAQNPPSKP